MIERLEYRGDMTDRAAVAARLQEHGLDPAASQRRAERFAQAAAMWKSAERDGATRPTAFFVPGRIEVLGKHTDYAGGHSMVVTTNQGFSLVSSPRRDNLVVVLDAVRGEGAAFPIAPGLAPRLGRWSNYAATVARRVARNFPGTRRGATIALASDLPAAAGMSSSSALVVSIFLALADANQLASRPEFRENIRDSLDLAGYLATNENGQSFGYLRGDSGVGTFGGSEDHTAMLCGKPGQVSQFAYCPARFVRAIPIPAGHTFAIATSGVVAEKTGAAREKYNRASRLASRLAERWRQSTGRDDPHLAAVLATGQEAAGQLKTVVQEAANDESEREALLKRLAHFVVENEQVIPAAGDALGRGDLRAFGELVDRSQCAAEELLGNQVAQTVRLAASARSLGASAASAFGAGFGGSVWAMVESDRAEEFLAAWADLYRAEFPERAAAASFFLTAAGLSAFQLG